MDIYCTWCGEPFDRLSLTDDFTEDERKDFLGGAGCPCCKGKPEHQKETFRGELQAELQLLLGDDLDGIASELDDAEYLLGQDFWAEEGDQ